MDAGSIGGAVGTGDHAEESLTEAVADRRQSRQCHAFDSTPGVPGWDLAKVRRKGDAVAMPSSSTV
ncbi:hypothetical protein TUM20985_15830 [Mycobacterium antarcticum]|nr:hypothetical protein TUM20985_15830 [Mycolicibacterium sp. TUM20985]GLP80183.1 hypothetical protein TUM20984_16030 [Mycolicibacterium sp. TUM20984]